MEKGLLTVSRVRSSTQTDFISIKIFNEKHKQKIEINISLPNYADTITGIAFRPCEYEIRGEGA